MKTLTNLTVILMLTGCAAVDLADYSAEEPKLDLATYFNGTIDGWGMVRDRTGKVTRRFVVVIDANWGADKGVLEESFLWSDGKREKRTWEIRKTVIATQGLPAISSAVRPALQAGARCIGSTCSSCRLKAGPITSTWMIGCT